MENLRRNEFNQNIINEIKKQNTILKRRNEEILTQIYNTIKLKLKFIINIKYH